MTDPSHRQFCGIRTIKHRQTSFIAVHHSDLSLERNRHYESKHNCRNKKRLKPTGKPIDFSHITYIQELYFFFRLFLIFQICFCCTLFQYLCYSFLTRFYFLIHRNLYFLFLKGFFLNSFTIPISIESFLWFF